MAMIKETDNEGTTSNEGYDSFMSYFHESKIPAPEEWPDDLPVYVCASSRAPYVKYDASKSKAEHQKKIQVFESKLELKSNVCYEYKPIVKRNACFPLNGEIIQFEGPLFKGIIASRIKEAPESGKFLLKKNRISNSEYFKGRSRKFQWTVQGKFKHRTRFDQVLTGQDFGRPFRNTPAVSLVKRGMGLLKNRLPDSFVCDLFSQTPKFEHPLVAGCQCFRIDTADEIEFDNTNELNINMTMKGESENGGITEDTTLLRDSSVPKKAELRRKYFSKQKNLEKFYFEPNLVYTFEFFANFFSPVRYSLELTPYFQIDVAPYFNGYPLFMAMAKDKKSGKYYWCTEMWHRRLTNRGEKPRFFPLFFSNRQTLKG